MLRAVDDWLIDSVFQRIADWISDRYQKSVFMTARICVYLELIFLIPRNILRFNGANIIEFVLNSLLPIFLLLLIRAEEERFERGGYGTMNELREYLRIFRFFYIITTPFSVVVLTTSLIDGSTPFLLTLVLLIGSLLITMSHYFASCSPKPPKPKEEKQEIPADAILET